MIARTGAPRFIFQTAACALLLLFALGQGQGICDSKPGVELERLRTLVRTQGFEETEQELLRSLSNADTAIESLALLYVEWQKPEKAVLLASQIPPREERIAARAARILADGGYLDHANQFLLSFLDRSRVVSWKLTEVRAELLIESGRYEEAIRILTTASNTPDQEPVRRYRLALANQGLRRWDAALSHIQKALSLRADPLYSYTEGLLLLSMDKLQEAEQVFAEGRRRFPNSPQLCLGYARLFSKVGDFYKAEGALKKAIELDPGHGEAHAHLARLFYLVGNWESFRPTIQRAIELQPRNFLACYYYGQLILLDGGDKAQERAVEYFEKSVRFDSSFAAGYIAIGQVWASQGKWKEALQSYQQAVQKDPRNNRVLYLMAQAYRSLGQTGEAKKCLERAGLAPR
jgi:tetratricopeptide (TPR) repeat protein